MLGRRGCVLVVAVHHTALDGPACLRVVATAAEIYGGRSADQPSAPARPQAAPPPAHAGPAPLARPARVAAGTPGKVPGNGQLLAELPVPRGESGAPYTVNDQLMVATALTVADWNRLHGSAGRPLRITMPVDDRTRGPRMPIGNGTRLVEVGFDAAEVASGTDIAALLHLTAERTRALKAQPRPQLGRSASLLTTPLVPVAARAAFTRGLRVLAGPWTSTTLLSEHRPHTTVPLGLRRRGEVRRAVDLRARPDAEGADRFTTASTGGRLHLALRWSRTLLGDEDGEALLGLFTRHLAATSSEAP
ncbi:Condensation protein OS=Streptomyces microflavus OX=1919 GN=HUT09_02840 PE=4 SV=1 [Streptomyces microflavus]